jgi:hypothetical protein
MHGSEHDAGDLVHPETTLVLEGDIGGETKLPVETCKHPP